MYDKYHVQHPSGIRDIYMMHSVDKDWIVSAFPQQKSASKIDSTQVSIDYANMTYKKLSTNITDVQSHSSNVGERKNCDEHCFVGNSRFITQCTQYAVFDKQ